MREVGCGTVFLCRALGVWGTAPRFLPLSGVGAGGLFFRARRHDAPCRARARQSAGGARLLAPPLREVSDSGRARHEEQGAGLEAKGGGGARRRGQGEASFVGFFRNCPAAKSLRHKKTASRYACQRLSPRCGMLLHAVKLPGREEQHAVATGYDFKLRQLFSVHRSSDKRKKELLHYAA